MTTYLRPDVYVEMSTSGEKPIQATSSSVAVFIGITALGTVSEPILINSWTEYVNTFASEGQPFVADSDLPNAVYGFFQNGGSKCYVVAVEKPLEGEADYEGALQSLEFVQDAKMVAIPSCPEDVRQALVTYCDQNELYAVLDLPKGTAHTSVKTLVSTVTGDNASFVYPNIKILDPLAKNTGVTKTYRACSPVGHILGMIARTDAKRGVYKAPAGEEAYLRGAVDLDVKLPISALGELNSLGVNCIVSKPNVGIVLWGARTISKEFDKRYVSDVRYDLMLKQTLYEGTQWAVFEPNDENLWARLETSITAFLDSEWRNGALRGATSSDAYYVKCDSELNTVESISRGELVAEIGYAKQKPAEFVVIRLVQKSDE